MSSYSRVERRYLSTTNESRGRRRQRPTALAASSNGVVATAQNIDGWPYIEVFGAGHGEVLTLRQPSRRPVTALALYEYSGRISEKGHRSRNVLVAASRDGVLLYYLEDALCSAQVPPYDGGTDEVVTPEPLQLAMAPQAEIEHVAFDDTGLLVAMCQGHFVDILQVSAAKGLAATSDSAGRFPRDDEERPPEPLMRLGDQGSIIIASCFLPAQPHILLIIAQDRTFRLVNLADLKQLVLYQSPILCASNLTAIAAHSKLPLFSVAAADGRVWVYELKGRDICREVWAFDLKRSMQRLEREQPIVPCLKTSEHGRRHRKEAAENSDFNIGGRVKDCRCDDGSGIGGGGDGDDGRHGVMDLPDWMLEAAKRDSQPKHHLLDSFPPKVPHNGGVAEIIERACVPLALEYFEASQLDCGPNVPPEMQQQSRGTLMVVTPGHLLAVDASSFDVSIVDSFHGEENDSRSDGAKNNTLALGIVARGCLMPSATFLSVVLVAAFEPVVAICKYARTHASRTPKGREISEAFPVEDHTQVNLSTLESGKFHRAGLLSTSGADNQHPLSLFPLSEIPAYSALRTELRTLPTKSKYQGVARRSHAHESWEKPNRLCGGKVVDQPVTFHTRIKSSGYGATAPRMKLGGSSASRRSSEKPQGRRKTNPMRHMYPIDCSLLTNRQPQNELPHPFDVPIVDLAYSSNAQVLAVASMDSVVRTLRLPVSRNAGEGSTFVGHSGRLHSVAFSHDCSLLLTASADKTACIWTLGTGRTDPALVFSHVQSNPRATERSPGPIEPPKKSFAVGGRGANGDVLPSNFIPTEIAVPTQRPNNLFEAEIKRAEFFYMDRFVLLANGGTIGMYSFGLDAKETNDLKRLQGLGRYRLVQEWEHDANVVTSFSCCNSMLSNLIISAASNKTVQILDAAVGSIARVISDAHQRPVHAVALPSPSPFVALDSAHYDVFLTVAADGVVALWDIRANRCTARFSEHVNRRDTSIKASFSPCMRYIASGSEDRAGILYDIRRGTAMSKLQYHTDVVSCVSWNPLFPQLATASYDGHIHFFTNSEHG